jgi:hypothetical protein
MHSACHGGPVCKLCMPESCWKSLFHIFVSTLAACLVMQPTCSMWTACWWFLHCRQAKCMVDAGTCHCCCLVCRDHAPRIFLQTQTDSNPEGVVSHSGVRRTSSSRLHSRQPSRQSSTAAAAAATAAAAGSSAVRQEPRFHTGYDLLEKGVLQYN